MDCVEANELDASDDTGGELEVENYPVHEVEVRRKDLLPVFDHFHRTPDWSDR